MSARLADIEARRENIADLSEIVGALKAIAANRMMQGESALASIRAYADSVEEMLSTTLIDRPLPQARATDHTKRGLILFSGEYGFTGAFTEKLIDDLVDTVTPDDHVFVVGQRGAIFVRERNIQPDWETPMATRIQSVSETAHRLTGELFRCIYQGLPKSTFSQFLHWRPWKAWSVKTVHDWSPCSRLINPLRISLRYWEMKCACGAKMKSPQRYWIS